MSAFILSPQCGLVVFRMSQQECDGMPLYGIFMVFLVCDICNTLNLRRDFISNPME